MGSDLIALVFALTLGAAVVILGLRRNLSETTRNGLPRFDPERVTPTLGLYEGEERPRPPLSPWLRAAVLLPLALIQAALAIESPDDRWIHATLAALAVVVAVVLLLRKQPDPSGGPAP